MTGTTGGGSGTTVSTGGAATVQAVHTAVSSVTFEEEGHESARPVVAGQDLFVFTPLEDVAIIAHFTGFGSPPGSVVCEIFAQAPGPTGGTAVVTVRPSAAATPRSARITWKYDPTAANQRALASASHAWLRVTADAATPLIAQIGLRARGFHDVKWSTGAVRPGASVTATAKAMGFPRGSTAEVKVYDALALRDDDIPDGTTALDTLTATMDAHGLVTATWSSARRPDPPASPPSPAPLPSVVFVVKVGDEKAVSRSLAVLPNIRLKLEPGDPNWLMERICAEAQGSGDDVSTTGASDDMGTLASTTATPGTRDYDMAVFPKRCLGIKQRLQALGYYYERLPAPPAPPPLPTGGTATTHPTAGSRAPRSGGAGGGDAAGGGAAGAGPATPPVPPPDANKQTRVFRKCFRWYWKKVYGQTGAPPMMNGDLDPNEVPPPPPPPGSAAPATPPANQIIDLYASSMTAFCRDLEDRVRAQVIMQDPDAAGGGGSAPSTVDLKKPVRLVFPGDLHFNNQEWQVHRSERDATGRFTWSGPSVTKPIDYTYRRPLNAQDDQDYSKHMGGLSSDDDLGWKGPDGLMNLGDFRFIEELLLYERNPALGKAPIVAKLEMQTRDGDDNSWVAGPDHGISVIFQLDPVPPDAAGTALPAHIDGLGLRATTNVTNDAHYHRRGAFPGMGRGAPHADPGPKGYLTGIYSTIRTGIAAAPQTGHLDWDPTWWNAPIGFGGKRSWVGGVGSAVGAHGVLVPGADAAALGVPPGHDFPWSAENATVAHPASTAQHHRAVSVPVARGKAVIILSPSRLGGDAYRVKAFVESPAAHGPPTEMGATTTETLTVWRRVRVTRYYKKDYPADWKTPPAAGTAEFTPRDRASPTADGVTPKDESGGDIADISSDDWTKIAGLYKKAFLVLEKPGAPTTLTLTLRDNAVRGALLLIDTVIRDPATGALDYSRLWNRSVFGVPTNPYPNYEPLRLARRGTDSPFMIDWNYAEDHDSGLPSGSTSPRAGRFPYNQYYHLLAALTDIVLAYAGMFLDEEYDPDQHATYDGVPFPGVTCVQALRADSYALAGATASMHLQTQDLIMPPGSDPNAPKTLGVFAPAGLGTTVDKLRGVMISTSTPRHPVRHHAMGAMLTNELGHNVVANVPVSSPSSFTLDQALQGYRSAAAFTHHADYGTDAPLLSASLDSTGVLVFEFRRTRTAGTGTPILTLTSNGATVLLTYQFRYDGSDPSKHRFVATARCWDASTLTPINYDEADPGRAGTLEHDLAALNLMTDLSEGDRLFLRRGRARDDATARANLPAPPEPPRPGVTPPPDTTTQNYHPPTWAKLEFIYGSGTPSPDATFSTSGRTLKQLNDFIRAHLEDAFHASRTGLVYALKRSGAAAAAGPPAVPATPDRFFEFRSRAMFSKWWRDGLMVGFTIQRAPLQPGDPPNESSYAPLDFEQLFRDPAHTDRGAVETEGASGIALQTRTFYLFYGNDEYTNSGFYGAAPNGTGRGYTHPGSLDMPYPLWINTAHELGHTLYLRHQWTGEGTVSDNSWNWKPRGDERPSEHDDDDLCHMGYFTSFLDGSAPARNQGRAELCGRCILKLRGWRMSLGTNAPDPTTATTGRPTTTLPGSTPPLKVLQPPPAGRTGGLDWWPVPIPTPPPRDADD